MVDCDEADYRYKSADRSLLDRLFALRGAADDVLIVRRGLITDTSIANVAPGGRNGVVHSLTSPALRHPARLALGSGSAGRARHPRHRSGKVSEDAPFQRHDSLRRGGTALRRRLISLHQLVTAHLNGHVQVMKHLFKHDALQVVILVAEGGSDALQDELRGAV